MAMEWARDGNDLIFQGRKGTFMVGRFSSGTQGYGVKVDRSSRTGAVKIYADDGGSVLWGSGSVPDIKAAQARLLLTKDNTGGNIRAFGLMGQVKVYDGKWNGEQVGAVYGRLEIVRSSATLTLGGYGVSSAGAFTVETSGAITVNTYHILAGVASISDFKATLTQTGKTAAFLAAAYDTTNWSDGTSRTTWGYGLLIPNSAVATGISIGTCTTGISIAGTVTTGVTITSTSTTGISITGTVAQGILVGTSSASPIITTSTGTTNMVEVNSKLNAASGTLRGVISYAEFSGTNVGVATNCYAVRGYAKVSGTFGGANAWAVGVQGKCELSGTMTDGRICAVLAQINASAGTFTAPNGELYGLLVDSQLTTNPGIQNFSLAKFCNVDTTCIPTSMLSMYGKALYGFELNANGGAWMGSTSGAVSTAGGWIKVSTAYGDRYIALFTTVTTP